MTTSDQRVPAVLANRPDTPILEGWIGIPEAGEMLGISRQHSFKLASKRPEDGGYATLHRIGSSFVCVVALSEIEMRIESKAARAKKPEIVTEGS